MKTSTARILAACCAASLSLVAAPASAATPLKIVTADSAARAAYFAKVRTAGARERIPWTDAIARERFRRSGYDLAGSGLRLTSVLSPLA